MPDLPLTAGVTAAGFHALAALCKELPFCKRAFALLISFLFLGICDHGLQAQEMNASPGSGPSEDGQPQQSESATNRWPSFGSELGRQDILRRPGRPRRFQVYSDTQYLYDSNVLLADGDFIEVGHDSVFIEGLGASFSSPIIEPLNSTIYYQHDLVRYDDFSKFDFDGDTVGFRVGGPVKDLFTVSGGFSASRYYFRQGGHEFYRFYDIELRFGREQPLGSRASLLYGYQLDWRPSSPSPLTRIDNSAYVGANLALIQRLSVHLGYRIRVREYYQADRTDLDHLLNFTLGYAFNDWASARFSVTYGVNNSSETAHDYEVVNVGGGLTLVLKF